MRPDRVGGTSRVIFRSARSAVLLSLVLVVAACGAGAGDDPERVFVSAAASLTDAFTDMESAFESVNPDVDVVLNIAGSSALREQITGGAPVDVFASASAPIMD
ncbi:extracellular solute-binding protein, partial [bacterium]|nr:extracellular solute-binding protein [bacterium]